MRLLRRRRVRLRCRPMTNRHNRLSQTQLRHRRLLEQRIIATPIYPLCHQPVVILLCPASTQLVLGASNVLSLNNKVDAIRDLFSSHDVDVLCLKPPSHWAATSLRPAST